ncbi:hypothetical protein ACFFJI_01245 [Allobacillus sp. GCM10007491]|uniref:Uncharacterized protein n=1 Tax=Allobacillus saliphilus TaxID=2912308 RepID=A0A941CTX5_9BACI|nr:hypothetical protein [Allobacillus saliphilus]MBR7553873.1 hypothetical protein [Allobacillus saliphilus]
MSESQLQFIVQVVKELSEGQKTIIHRFDRLEKSHYNLANRFKQLTKSQSHHNLANRFDKLEQNQIETNERLSRIFNPL